MTDRRLAIILAGGKGTRLGPYTAVFPKPLVPVGEWPIVEILVRQLYAAGFREMVLSVAHHGHLLEAYFLNHPLRAMGVSLTFVREQEPMGTAGSVKLVENLPEDFLVLNGDILTTLDFAALFDTHRCEGSALTVAVRARPVQLQLGVVEREGTRVVGYREKPRFEFEVSMGAYVYNRRAVERIPAGRFDFPDLVLDMVRAGERVTAFPSDAEWLDIGNPDDYALAQEAVARNAGAYLPAIAV